MKTYILTFIVNNARMPDLENFVRYSPHIRAYWNHIPLVYCVKSELTAAQLREKIEPFFPQGGFMVAELNAANVDGRLPEDAWKWFYAAPPPSGGLGMLGGSNALIGNPTALGGLGLLGQDPPKSTGLFGGLGLPEAPKGGLFEGLGKKEKK
ncbi:MAG: hypothetical protein KDK75_14930 [Alphaproteobacteria bacterium]|nr:hypothetical protein [Alphaproteobacteria bacterium]